MPTVGGAADKCPLRPTLSNCELCIAVLVSVLVFRVVRTDSGFGNELLKPKCG